MYEDKKRHSLLWLGCAVFALVLALTVWLFMGKGDPSPELQRQAEASIRETIRRTALQCFAVEGAYPKSLRYMEENYGLRINTEDYYVVYEIFADNLPPNIRVAKKEG